MAQISLLQRIQAPADRVYSCLVTASGIAGWLTQASGDHDREGGTLTLLFPDEQVSFEVTSLVAPARLVWRCVTPSSPWMGTEVRFELVQKGATTLVRFDHLNWPEVTDLFRDCSMSWAYFLGSLRALVEDGKGTPEV